MNFVNKELIMERLICYSFNNQTRIVEKFIKDAICLRNEYPLQNVSSENVRIIVDALMSHYSREYRIDYIDLMPFSNDGMKVIMKLDALDDWDSEEIPHATKHWLYRIVSPIVEVMGKPTHVLFNNGCYYACWTRNMVTWF